MAKVRGQKRPKGKPPKRGFPTSWVVAALFLAAVAGIFVLNSQQLTLSIPEAARAAIIDQLYASYPNEEFTTRVTRELEDYGFEVDVYQGDTVTVDFYENLLTYGYSLIVFRAHSGLVAEVRELDLPIGTYLFTNETYSSIKHPREQLNDEVRKARVGEGYPYVFAIGPKFITDSMKGNFDNTVVIIGGCSGLSDDDLAQAFVDRGASAYLAWDDSVDLDYIDEAVVSLVKNLCSKRVTVKTAVELTMATIGPDPKHHAVLGYYPRGNGNKTIGELIGN